MSKVAEEYLKHLQLLQSTHALDSHSDIDHIYASMKSKPDIKKNIDLLTDDQREEWFNKVSTPLTVFDEILKTLKMSIFSGLPESSVNKLNKIPIGTLHTYTLNARTIQSPDGSPIIIMNNGILGFAHDMGRLIAASFPHLETSRNKLDLSQLAYKASMSCIHFLSDGKLQTDWYIILNENQTFNSVLLRNDIELFILAHELGHNIMGHLGELSSMKIKGIHDESIKYYKRRREQEYEADKWAIDLLHRIPADNRMNSPFSTIAPVIFFLTWSLFEKVAKSLNKIAKDLSAETLSCFLSDSTHPPTIERLEYAERQCYNNCSEDDVILLEYIKILFHEIIQRIK